MLNEFLESLLDLKAVFLVARNEEVSRLVAEVAGAKPGMVADSLA